MLSFSVISCSYPPPHDTDYLQFDFRMVPFYFRTISSVSANLRPFPSDFGHLRPFYSLQNRCIFIRFCRRTEACARWPRRLALRTGHALAFACHTKLRLFCGLKKGRRSPRSHGNMRKLTQVNANWRYLPEVDFLCFWFQIIVSVFGRYHLVSDTCFRLRKIASVLEQYPSASDTSDKKNI